MKQLVFLLAIIVSVAFAQSATSPESKALAFLQREVPAWKKDNGCFSCHNNGDAARALFLARQKGYAVPADTLTDTIAWLRAPAQWEENKGDPGFSDKRLANLQFAAALLAEVETGQIRDRAPLNQAAQKLVAEQDSDGTWKIDTGNTLGSPATWGTPMATWMGWRVLQQVPQAKAARDNAARALLAMQPKNVPTAATLLLFFTERNDPTAHPRRDECRQFLLRAQTSEGGWGPYPDAPAECFDTALVLLALWPERKQAEIQRVIQRGRAFLIAQQAPDGSWPATTRPSGGTSYAQMMSTTGWGTLALLTTKE